MTGGPITLECLLRDVDDPVYAGCGPTTRVEGLEVDSRRVRPGQAFLAVRGATHDGHEFVEQVIGAGAGVLLLRRGRIEAPAVPHVWLPDTGAAHPVLAANAFGRPGERLRSCAITGTNGKTTTAHLVGSIFATAGRAYARLGTTGNFVVDEEVPASLTTPFPLELQALLASAVDRGATDLVMEASSHALEQGRVEPLRFDAIGFTSFSQDHLDFHADMEAYLVAKCRLASRHLRAGGHAVAAVDGRPAALRFLAAARDAGGRTLRASRGEDRAAEILVEQAELAGDCTRARVRTPAGVLELTSPLIGSYNLDNLLVAIGLALALGVEPSVIETALATARGAPGRLERVSVAGVRGPAVVVDYAHTPDAVERAIAAVRAICSGRLHVLLGCGGDRDPTKRPLMGAVAAAGADRFWATSDNPRTEPPERIMDAMLAGVLPQDRAKVVREVDRARAIARAIAEAAPEDLVLIAGKGHEDYQILGTQKIHFDDREHARAALSARRSTLGD